MKTDCEIIRDLMPLFIDGEASRKSSEAITDHIAECPDCGRYFKELSEIIPNIDSEGEAPSTCACSANPKKASVLSRRLHRERTLLISVSLSAIALSACFAFSSLLINARRNMK